MTVLFVGRHGETRLNSEERLRAWLDEPLNADGIKEAKAMGDLMKQYPIDRVYCSDLDRADHTAEIVAKRHGLKQIPRAWFRPLDYGDLSGKRIADIQPELDKLNEIWQTEPDHEAPGGESFTSFQARNLGGLHAILQAAKADEQIMLVAHLRNCLLFHAVAVHGGPLQGESIRMMEDERFHQESGGVSRFEWDGRTLTFAGILEGEGKPKKEVGVS